MVGSKRQGCYRILHCKSNQLVLVSYVLYFDGLQICSSEKYFLNDLLCTEVME